MRVLVTGTGRCGTMTFRMACRHILNYTSGHETAMRNGPLIPSYPDDHIEVDGHLTHVLPLMLDRYPNAVWVHLIRDRDACVRSLAKRETMDRWSRMAFMSGPSRERAADVYYETTNRLIEQLLPSAIRVQLEKPALGLAVLWERIHARGDYESALMEFKNRYNRSTDDGDHT